MNIVFKCKEDIKFISYESGYKVSYLILWFRVSYNILSRQDIVN